MYVLKIGQVGPPSIKSSVYYKHPQYVKLDSRSQLLWHCITSKKIQQK